MWREDVESPLRGFLAGLGATAHEIDDVVQETALRALESPVPFQDGVHLRRWCFVVGRRCWIDVRRRGRRSAPLDDVVGQVDPRGAEWVERVEDRQILDRIGAVLPLLRTADRDALLSPVPHEAGDARERNRRNVARHRARARLKMLVGPLAAGSGWGLAGLLRRWPRAAVGAGALPVLVVFAVSPLTAPWNHGPTLLPSATAGAAAPATGAVQDAAPQRDPWPRAGLDQAVPSRRASTLGSPEPTAVLPRVEGPGGAHASVARRARLGGDALVCLSGDVVDVCVDVQVEAEPPVSGPGAAPLVTSVELTPDGI